MAFWFLRDDHLKSFVAACMGRLPVIAPVAKRTRFVFAELKSPDELRLDYDTTILPPKKAFIPTRQELVHFDDKGFHAALSPKEKIILGVHPYDLKAISMMDWIHEETNFDEYYHANRKAVTIIGCSVQKHYKHAFFGSVCMEKSVSGHDMFLTKIAGGYLADVVTKKGEALLACGEFQNATKEQVAEADRVNREAFEKCPEKLSASSFQIKHKVRMAFGNEDFWKEASEDCFACGNCNIVCPTCYCFDIQDEWNVDGASGTRFRRWDACLTAEFSEVSIQGGTENFRGKRFERFRHRVMRKTTFLNEKLGAPACVGCGRCAGACPADIADPAPLINRIMES